MSIPAAGTDPGPEYSARRHRKRRMDGRQNRDVCQPVRRQEVTGLCGAS